MILHDYYRSSAAYRVRIALNIKQIQYQQKVVNLINNEQQSSCYKELNPQGLVPTLQHKDLVISQSLTICDYLDDQFPTPPLMPENDVKGRMYVKSLASIIASDIHPLNNLRVLRYLTDELKINEVEKSQWYKNWVLLGLEAFEDNIKLNGLSGTYCYKDLVTMADITLIPQLYNAKRFNIDYSHFENISAIEKNCMSLHAFKKAHPENNRR